MEIRKAIESAIDLVPNWFVAPAGYNSYDITIDGITVHFYSLRRLTPALVDLLEWIRTGLPAVIRDVEAFPDEVGIDLIQEFFAERWLSRAEPRVNWKKLFDYSRNVSRRTYENAEVTFNFIIRPETSGTVDITAPLIQKIIDPLASSRWTYFELDANLQFRSFEEESAYLWGTRPIKVSADGEIFFSSRARGHKLALNSYEQNRP